MGITNWGLCDDAAQEYGEIAPETANGTPKKVLTAVMLRLFGEGQAGSEPDEGTRKQRW
jgi:hypothetical protein